MTFCFFFFSSVVFKQFGVSVLLDPVWNTDNLQCCTKTFRAVLKLVHSANMPFPPEKIAANETVFLTVVKSLSKEDLSEHVRHMLSRDTPFV